MKRRTFAKSVGEPNGRRISFVGSSETEDRDGDVIRAPGIGTAHFAGNPVFLAMHDMRKLPIGRVVEWGVRNNRFEFTAEFLDPEDFRDPVTGAVPEHAQFADTVFRLYKSGILSAVSIGFKPVKWVERSAGGFDFTEIELLEISAVTVPSNRDALMIRGMLGDEPAESSVGDSDGEPEPMPAPEDASPQKGTDATTEPFGVTIRGGFAPHTFEVLAGDRPIPGVFEIAMNVSAKDDAPASAVLKVYVERIETKLDDGAVRTVLHDPITGEAYAFEPPPVGEAQQETAGEEPADAGAAPVGTPDAPAEQAPQDGEIFIVFQE